MNARFFDLKKEKQDRIINAALKVFALHGYRHASTDDIVREASISKGLLFHYFESKLGVYAFVYEYSVRYMILEIKACVDRNERDLFELMKQTECARMHAPARISLYAAVSQPFHDGGCKGSAACGGGEKERAFGCL